MTKLLVCILTILTISVVSCEKLSVETSSNYIGEWRYVGTFDHRSNYPCYVCPDFDFEKPIYRMNLKEKNMLTSQVNFMRGEGTYVLEPRDKMSDILVYNFSIKDYKELNKPIETEADGVFRNALLNAYRLSMMDQEVGYDQLSLQFNENEFLLFVKKN